MSTLIDDEESRTVIESEPPLRRPHAVTNNLNRSDDRIPSSDAANKQKKIIPSGRSPAAERPHFAKPQDVRNHDQRNNNQDNRSRGYNQDRQGNNQGRQGNNQDRRGYNQDRKSFNHNQRRPQRQEIADDENWEDNKQKEDATPYPKSSNNDSKLNGAAIPKANVEPKSTATAYPKVNDEPKSNATGSQAIVQPKSVAQNIINTVKTADKVPAVTATCTDAAPERVQNKGPALTAALTTPVPRAKTAARVDEKPLVPAKCIVDLAEVGATLMVSIESKDEESNCFVCLTLHADYQDDYLKLCTDYSCDDDDKEFCATPGTTFSFRPAGEASWYRARGLSLSHCALLDAGRRCELAGGLQRGLLTRFAQPEFCAALAPRDLVEPIQVGDQVQCVIESKSMSGVCQVTIADMETDSVIGKAELKRWLPKIEYPPAKTVTAENKPACIPAVPRPALADKSTMEVVHFETRDVVVRARDDARRRDFDMIEQDVAVYGLNATPLKEPPSMGDTVIAKFTDGNHYRVLCKRTNVTKNKYLLEYIEYGNTEISCLEKLYECPPQFNLNNRPPLTSRVTLHAVTELSDAAVAYLSTIRDDSLPVVVSLQNNEETAPSGAEVTLTLAKNKENINNKLIEMSKPEWKKVEEKGGDMFDLTPVMLEDISYLPLEPADCHMKIVDCSMIEEGALSVVALAHLPALQHALGPLTDQMEEYCNSKVGSEPYLPRLEEVCIAKFPPYEQWYRAVFCEHIGGPGGATASLLYLDYGNLETVGVDCLRKCPKDFATVPVAVCNADIHGFPENPTAAQLAKAREYLKIESEAGGELTATKCEPTSHGMYTVHVPGLIAAMNSV